MKALTPEPIDRERAKTDVLYFAKKYLDLHLADWQVPLVEAVINGEDKQFVGGTARGRRVAADVAIAMARHKGFKVRVIEDRKPIEGEVVENV